MEPVTCRVCKAWVPLVQRLEKEPARGVPVPTKGAADDPTATPR